MFHVEPIPGPRTAVFHVEHGDKKTARIAGGS
jgi:hypothetical protein